MTYQPTWHLKGTPYQVQLEALRKSRGKDRFAYFLEQGLGKSSLVLNDCIENYPEIKTAVTLCPNSFKMDWSLLPGEWGAKWKTAIWPYDEFERGKFNIMNFEAVRAGGFEHALKVVEGSILVVDESSAIKNYRSQTSKAVLELAKRAKVVRLLNGTPMSQNVLDLFPQLKCVGELDKVNPFSFRNKFAVMGGFMGKQIKGIRNENYLQEILDRCSFRALKKDWSDLPEKRVVPVHIEMTPKQRMLYKQMLEDFFTLVDDKEFSASVVLAQCEKLRQITSGCLIDGHDFVLIEEPKNNPKIKAALDIIEGGSGKVIIVHFYRKMGEAILDFISIKKLNPSYIRGGMEPEEIKEQKDKFNNDPTCRVKVAQITASSRAHTLLGQIGNDRCHTMIYHDATFNMLDRAQMDDRIHRGAQDQMCLYYDLICSPVDEAQISAVHKKQDVASRVVDAVRALRGSLR